MDELKVAVLRHYAPIDRTSWKIADHRDTNGYNRKVANGQESAGSDRKT